MLDPRLPEAIGQALDWVEDGLGSPPLPHSLSQQLLTRCRALRARLSREERFPPVALAVALAGNFATTVGAACTALYMAADLIDDAQDDDLHADWSGGWQAAVCGGQALTFQAQSILASLPADTAADAGRTMAYGGTVMVGGQVRDLAAVFPSPWVDQDQAIDIALRKTGAAFAVYARISAIAGDLPRGGWDALWEWGRGIGAACQIESDLADLVGPARDLRRRKLTLPLLHALAVLPEEPRRRLIGTLEEEAVADIGEARALVLASGAASYVAARAELLRSDARERLQGLWLPWGGRTILEALSEPAPIPANPGSRP